jgi:hypothetical protein
MQRSLIKLWHVNVLVGVVAIADGLPMCGVAGTASTLERHPITTFIID